MVDIKYYDYLTCILCNDKGIVIWVLFIILWWVWCDWGWQWLWWWSCDKFVFCGWFNIWG